MTGFNREAFALRDSVCADEEHCTDRYAAVLGVPLAQVDAELQLITQGVAGEHNSLKLKAEGFFLARQRVLFELRAMGQPVSVQRARDFVRVLQAYDVFQSLQAIAEALPTTAEIRGGLVYYNLPAASPKDNDDPMLNPSDAMVLCSLSSKLKTFAAAEAKVGHRPITRVDVPAALKEHGYSGFPRQVTPSQEQADSLRSLIERKSRLAPYVDFRVHPWVDAKWLERSGSDSREKNRVSEEVLHAVSEEAESVTGIGGTGEALVAAATVRAAASMASSTLGAAPYLAAATRFAHAMAIVGSFGAPGIQVAASYVTRLTAVAARRGFTVMATFDTQLRRHAAAENWTREEIADLFAGRPAVGDKESFDSILRAVLDDCQERRLAQPKPQAPRPQQQPQQQQQQHGRGQQGQRQQQQRDRRHDDQGRRPDRDGRGSDQRPDKRRRGGSGGGGGGGRSGDAPLALMPPPGAPPQIAGTPPPRRRGGQQNGPR